ncbi:hypothetical protein ACHAWF_010540, partial [Thalassiosira exigua]
TTERRDRDDAPSSAEGGTPPPPSAGGAAAQGDASARIPAPSAAVDGGAEADPSPRCRPPTSSSPGERDGSTPSNPEPEGVAEGGNAPTAAADGSAPGPPPPPPASPPPAPDAPRDAPPAPPCRRASLSRAETHRSFFRDSRHHTLQRSSAKQGLFADDSAVEEESAWRGGEGEDVRGDDGDGSGPAAMPAAPQDRGGWLRWQHLAQASTRPSASAGEDWRAKTRRFFSQMNIDAPRDSGEGEEGRAPRGNGDDDGGGEAEEGNEDDEEEEPPPNSEVERIVRRLERRAADRVHVPADVKARFLRMCAAAARRKEMGSKEGSKRGSILRRPSVVLGGPSGRGTGALDDSCTSRGDPPPDSLNALDESYTSEGDDRSNAVRADGKGGVLSKSSSCIARSDLIRLRRAVRLEVEGRTKARRIRDGIESRLGFRCRSKVLLYVLNRAVDSVDEDARAARFGKGGATKEAKTSRRDAGSTGGVDGRPDANRGSRRGGVLAGSVNGGSDVDCGPRRGASVLAGSVNSNSDANYGPRRGSVLAGSVNSGSDVNCGPRRGSILADSLTGYIDCDFEDVGEGGGGAEDDEEERFYYKDFAFYSLLVESNYPWVRNAGLFSILTTAAFYLFTPIFWCTWLEDPNVCSGGYGGWLNALFFASATMSTVGYGDVSVFVGSDDPDTPEPSSARVFVATLFMILSLVVSVVGFQAGLDSQFSPFRQRLDVFGRRVYEILREAGVVGRSEDARGEVASQVRWSRFVQLGEICLIFLILNLVGVFGVQLSLLFQKEDEFGERLSVSWMESLYWAVQTTTTIGYGDVTTPDNLRWFSLLYLAISTYFVGSAFGKLGELSNKLESMQRLYLWQQQEASYTMLHDFSGRPDGQDAKHEPEIDQFEFTLASLVVMGKITYADVQPIIQKFQQLSGENNKISATHVSGPEQNEHSSTEVETNAQEKPETDANGIIASKSSSAGALMVGKKIAQAFREEVLSSSVVAEKGPASEERESANHSNFRIPDNTHAIAIDDSKIQRKLLAKLFSFAEIPAEKCTVVGDGHDEIMGFEDYVVKFMDNYDGYVLMIVDENLDVVDECSNPVTISGSMCVEKIRSRLSPEAEKRMLALIRSANDSASDIAVYNSRAHGFLPKAPIKQAKVKEMLAPFWRERFPTTSDLEMAAVTSSTNTNDSMSDVNEIASCTPYDVAQKLVDIEDLFEKKAHIHSSQVLKRMLHDLKGDLLTLNLGKLELPVTSVVGQIDLMQVDQAPENLGERWRSLHDNINSIVQQLQKHVEKTFQIPKNTYSIAIDDSKIQRKLLSKFFDVVGIPPDHAYVIGETASEIRGFEDFVVDFMQEHIDDFVFLVVDENLDIVDESSQYESISGSQCIENIRKRLPANLEKRMLALVRSANDSTTDIAIYNKRAHGFLPKAPIRREKVNETIAPMWLKRFPISEFGFSSRFETREETLSVSSEELASTPFDIAQKMISIDSLFKMYVHLTDTRIIHDQLFQLKGDLLTLNSDANKMMGILGNINLILLGQNLSPEMILEKWHSLRDRVYGVIDSSHNSSARNEGSSATRKVLRRVSMISEPRKKVLSNSVVSTCSSDSNNSTPAKRETNPLLMENP